jgi:hypothetical protein
MRSRRPGVVTLALTAVAALVSATVAAGTAAGDGARQSAQLAHWDGELARRGEARARRATGE